MDRKMARRNLRSGFSMFILEFALIGAAFIWAAIYLGVVK